MDNHFYSFYNTVNFAYNRSWANLYLHFPVGNDPKTIRPIRTRFKAVTWYWTPSTMRRM